MKIKFVAVVAAIALALFVIGAKEANPSPKLVEIGGSYLISNGAAAVRGKVVNELGDGWYSVTRTDGGGTVAVNVALAFFIQPAR